MGMVFYLVIVTGIIQGVHDVVCGEVIGDAGGVKMTLDAVISSVFCMFNIILATFRISKEF